MHLSIYSIYSVHSLYITLLTSYASFMLFFFNDTATTEIYTLSLHDALPISSHKLSTNMAIRMPTIDSTLANSAVTMVGIRSEEHTSELQSHLNLVCRLLLEKKKA